MRLALKYFSAVVLMMLLHTAVCAAAAPSCKKFQTGTFFIKSMPEVEVTRENGIQIEHNKKKNSFSKYSVTWKNDCTYEVRIVSSTDSGLTKFFNDHVKVLTVTITATRGDEYDFSAISPASSNPITGTMIRKKK